MEIDFFLNPFQFNILMFFIMVGISYLFANFLEIKKFQNVVVFHAILIFIFAIIGILDSMFIFIAILEFAILFYLNKGDDNSESD